MPDSTDGQEQTFDVTPYLRLVIDKEGHWFQNGAEIIHREVYLAFCRALEKTAEGEYRIRIGQEVCRVEVEDAPFVVRSILDDENGRLYMLLNDETIEAFHPDKFWIGPDNIPYAKVKECRFHARLSRPAYYELAKHLTVDDDDNAFFVANGLQVPIGKTAGSRDATKG
ncbi:MAG: DUF1285 domain-containing protein [Desulfomonile sp.]|nr:DUF1285 domain-containing protein [Desulfomonile sp.]